MNKRPARKRKGMKGPTAVTQSRPYHSTSMLHIIPVTLQQGLEAGMGA
jgi:hypothetical protein